MSVTQVQKIYPETVPVNSEDAVFQNGDEIIFWIKLRIEKKMLGKYPFRVDFAFDKKGGLGKVQWAYSIQEKFAEITAGNAFDTAYSSLIASYGQPDMKKPSSKYYPKGEVQWIRNGAVIILNAFVISDTSGFVFINYDPIEKNDL